ncbi:MAG TPA: hypothetical protein VGJ59_14645, partial [Jatrophihabitantaceae bacterium]
MSRNASIAPIRRGHERNTELSFLKERGRSSGLCLVVVLVLVFSDAVRVNAGEAWGSRIGRKADREA